MKALYSFNKCAGAEANVIPQPEKKTTDDVHVKTCNSIRTQRKTPCLPQRTRHNSDPNTRTQHSKLTLLHFNRSINNVLHCPSRKPFLFLSHCSMCDKKLSRYVHKSSPETSRKDNFKNKSTKICCCTFQFCLETLASETTNSERTCHDFASERHFDNVSNLCSFIRGKFGLNCNSLQIDQQTSRKNALVGKQNKTLLHHPLTKKFLPHSHYRSVQDSKARPNVAASSGADRRCSDLTLIWVNCMRREGFH